MIYEGGGHVESNCVLQKFFTQNFGLFFTDLPCLSCLPRYLLTKNKIWAEKHRQMQVSTNAPPDILPTRHASFCEVPSGGNLRANNISKRFVMVWLRIGPMTTTSQMTQAAIGIRKKEIATTFNGNRDSCNQLVAGYSFSSSLSAGVV